MGRLDGKVAFLTGGGSGIGRAACVAFAREGAKVAIIDINPEGGAKTEATIREFSDEVLFIPTDVTDDASVRAAMEATVSRFGKLDVLFNCAGGSELGDGLVHEMDLAVWQRTVALNLLHPFLCCRYAIPHLMRNGGGSIINVSSHTSLIGSVRPIYAACKGGLNSLSRTLAAQYSAHGIRSNSLVSGTVRSERSIKRHAQPSAETAERLALKQLYPFSVGEPEDMAAVAVFLASDESRMINGATLTADGGRSAYLKVLPMAQGN